MNAHDSSSVPEPRSLSERTRASLLAAIADVHRNDGAATDALRSALREAAAEARARGLRPEELVIALKELLDQVPPSPQHPTAGEQLKLRERIISACITAYFRDA